MQKYWNGTELTLTLIGLPKGTNHAVIRTTDGAVYGVYGTDVSCELRRSLRDLRDLRRGYIYTFTFIDGALGMSYFTSKLTLSQ